MKQMYKLNIHNDGKSKQVLTLHFSGPSLIQPCVCWCIPHFPRGSTHSSSFLIVSPGTCCFGQDRVAELSGN